MHTRWMIIGALILGCSLFAQPGSPPFYSDRVIDQLRLEISDLKHELHTAKVEMNILEERVAKHDAAVSSLKNPAPSKEATSVSALTFQISALEKKTGQLESLLERMTTDLRTLSKEVVGRMQTLETELAAHERKFDEVVKLKATLTSISKAIGVNSSVSSTAAASTSSGRTYRVKAGDSLEKIARREHVSMDAIKKLNRLGSDKIVIGQELVLPDEGS